MIKSSLVVPSRAHQAFMDAFPGLTVHKVVQQECARRGLNDLKIHQLAAQHDITISEVLRKILVAGRPELAAAWTSSKRTPKQMAAAKARRNLQVAMRRQAAPAFRYARDLTRAISEAPDGAYITPHMRRLATMWRNAWDSQTFEDPPAEGALAERQPVPSADAEPDVTAASSTGQPPSE